MRQNCASEVPPSTEAANSFLRILKHSPDDVMKAVMKPLRDALKSDAEQVPPGRAGWDLLMEYDTFSTRQYLAT